MVNKAITGSTWEQINKVLLGYSRNEGLEQRTVLSMAKEQLEHFLPLTRQVVCQICCRVLEGESVPAVEKIVSLFEEHADIIRKEDRCDTYYGHKIYLTGGASNLILEGNPADSSLTEMMLDRQELIYGRYPLKAAFDSGFSSQENLKKEGIKDVCFSKGRGLDINDNCRLMMKKRESPGSTVPKD